MLENYPFRMEITLAWGEMDAFQHINNVAYFRYLESTRIAYMEKLGIMQHMQKTHIGPILASAQCQFKAPLFYPDTILSAAAIADIQSDRFNIEHLILSRQRAKPAAKGRSLIVFYDYGQKRKTTIPAELERVLIEQAKLFKSGVLTKT